MNKIELVPDERKKILKNPDLILLDKELLLALLKDSDFPDEENLVDIRNVFLKKLGDKVEKLKTCLLYTSPSPRDQRGSRMPSSA